MTANILQKNFNKEVLEQPLPVLVDFWAKWCAPCKMMAPLLDQIAEMRSDIKIVKVDIDENPELASKYGVRSVPTLMLFKAGEIEGTKTGAINQSQLLAFIDNNIWIAI